MFIFVVLSVTFALADSLIIPNELQDTRKDSDLTAVEMIKKYGYHGEVHYAVTKDNYVLEMHRITQNNAVKGRPVAFVMHGILVSSAGWLIGGPGRGLAYILADAGYDVWLGNARGSTYSRRHMSPSISDKDYWNFSWHEIGTRDLPAMIDYILEKTGQSKLTYLGHSQGTTAFFVMASQLEDYQEKINAVFAMAPVTYSKRMFSPIFQLLSRFSNTIYEILKLFGTYELKPTDEALKLFSSIVCKEGAITQPFCSNILFLIAGYSADHLNEKLITTITAHIPAGSSTKQFVHYAQLIKSGYFRQYDHGFFNNIKIYGTSSPPSYNLRAIKLPVYLYYSPNDWLCSEKDVQQLYDELPNAVGMFNPHRTFNHLDFMWGKDVKELLFDKILKEMKLLKV